MFTSKNTTKSLGCQDTHESIKLYPSLAVASIKHHLDKEFSLWAELRAVNSSGSGVLDDMPRTVDKLVGLGLYRSAKTVYRLLKAGDGLFWDISYKKGRTRMQIKALQTLVEYFDIAGETALIGRSPLRVPLTSFTSRAKKRACLYSSFFRPEGSKAKPISRQSITEATGVCLRQQRRYDTLAHIKRTPNYAFQEVRGVRAPLKILVETKHKRFYLNKRLGNTYHTSAQRAPRGMAGPVAAQLRLRFKKRSLFWCATSKRYFLSLKSCMRATDKHPEPYLLVREGQRAVRGRQEWLMVGA